MRKVKVYSTSTGLKVIDSEATTWGQLKDELEDNHDISLSNMSAVENKNNSSLVLNEAILPEGDFVLMLTPQKTKSGAYTYNEARAAIKAAFEDNKEFAHAHFNQGKNYTNKSTQELNNLLDSWTGSNASIEVKVAEKKEVIVQTKDNTFSRVLNMIEGNTFSAEEKATLITMLGGEVKKFVIKQTTFEEDAWIATMKNKL